VKKNIDTSIIFIFIDFNQNFLKDAPQKDEFFLISINELQKIIEVNYQNHLIKCNGIRPINSKSVHTKVTNMDLIKFKDNWEILHPPNHFT